MTNINSSPSLLSDALRILDKWHVEHSAQLQLLNLPNMHPRMLKRAHNNDNKHAEDQNMLQRIRHIFDINHTLQTLFPHNADMADYWVTTPNIQLQQHSPLEFMLAHGEEGMQTVVEQLNGNSW